MGVAVDKARQDIHALRIDLVIALGRTHARIDRQAGRADAGNPGDPVAFNDDINRPDRRRPRAVDQRGAANDQAFERTLAVYPVGGGIGGDASRPVENEAEAALWKRADVWSLGVSILPY